MTAPAASAKRACKRCGQLAAVLRRGGLRAHLCPHAGWCIVPYARRRQGEKGKPCDACARERRRELARRQLTLPGFDEDLAIG